jgi:ATP-binding cassette subfamily B protein
MAMFRGLEQGDKYDRQYTDNYLYKRIGSYLKDFKREAIIIVASLTLLSFLAAFQPVWFSDAIDSLQTAGDGLPWFKFYQPAWLFQSFHHMQRIEGASDALTFFVVALFITAFIQYFVGWLRRYLTGVTLGNIVANLRKDAFNAALQRDLAFYDKNKSGKIVSRITNDTQEFGEVAIIASDVITQMIQLIVLMIILFNASFGLTMLLILSTPVTLAVSAGFRVLARKVSRSGSRATANVNDNIQESVSGISVAKNFRRESFLYEEFNKVNRQSFKANMLRGLVLAAVFPVLNIVAGAVIALVTYTGAQSVVAGQVSLGVWYLFIQGVDRFYFPILNLSTFWSQFQQALSSTERIFALIDADNTVKQIADESVKSIEGKIEFDDVTFAYDDGTVVLKNFNLTIAPGESVAFVGHTGAGKSTIAKLITRFYEFQSGAIRVDGRDIRSLNMRQYRSKLGLVPQQPFLFSGTVLENIRYARPEATDTEIDDIAHSIGKGEWLETLPHGLHTDVGERGARLSMGQRQLVSLVRVLVQSPAIFILDEATASVDPFTESQIQEALELILKRSSSILIAHRLSTVRSADRIIVLKGGEIIEQGSHKQLMTAGGHYSELYDTYFRHQSLDYIENSRAAFAQQSAG